MLTEQEILKNYEINSILEFYNITYESYLNGNLSQAREQFRMLTVEQRQECFKYLVQIIPVNQLITFICAVIIKGVQE